MSLDLIFSWSEVAKKKRKRKEGGRVFSRLVARPGNRRGGGKKTARAAAREAGLIVLTQPGWKQGKKGGKESGSGLPSALRTKTTMYPEEKKKKKKKRTGTCGTGTPNLI